MSFWFLILILVFVLVMIGFFVGCISVPVCVLCVVVFAVLQQFSHRGYIIWYQFSILASVFVLVLALALALAWFLLWFCFLFSFSFSLSFSYYFFRGGGEFWFWVWFYFGCGFGLVFLARATTVLVSHITGRPVDSLS